MTPTRNPASVSNGEIIRASRELAPLLEAARQHLAIFRPRVCSTCHHVFSPSGRVSGRCLDCEVRE